MTEVYVVLGIFNYEGAEVVKIFASEDDAKTHVGEWHRKKRRNGRAIGGYDDMAVQQWEVE